MKRFLEALFSLAIVILVAGCRTAPSAEDKNVIHLLNGQNLDEFYSFLRGIGLTNDPHKVFTLMSNGTLRISGQDWGYLATKKDYSNYKLVAEFRWGKQTWGDRLTNARDSGILVHMGGKDQVWPKSIEAQIIEGGTGDILVVNGAYLTVDGVRKGPGIARFDRPGRNPWQDVKGFRGPHEIEKPAGRWNRMEVLCDGEKVSIK